MKVGIIVHSRTGFTYTVAKRLEEKFSVLRHDVQIERIIPVDEKQTDIKKIQFKSTPDLQVYDVVIFGAWVRGGSLSLAMAAYMTQMPSLQGKKVACFVTKGLPFSWTGGNQSINQMKMLCGSKDGKVVETGMVIRMGQRKKQIANLIEKFSKIVKK